MATGYNEKIVKAYFAEHKLPPVVFEYRFHSERKWRFDIAFPTVKVAIEVQGGIWIGGAHARGKYITRDYEKINEALLLGWIILQVQPRDLLTEETVSMVKRAVALTLK